MNDTAVAVTAGAQGIHPIEASSFNVSVLQSWIDATVTPDAIGTAIAHSGVELAQFDAASEAVPDGPMRDQVRVAFLVEASAMPRRLPGVHRGSSLSHRRVRDFLEVVRKGKPLASFTTDEVRRVAVAYAELGMPLQYLLSMMPDDPANDDHVWFFMYRFLNEYRGDEYLTDGASARRLVALSGDNIRYCPEQGWLTWTGQRWQRDSEAAEVTRTAKRVAATWDGDADIVHQAAMVAPNEDDLEAMMKRAGRLWNYAKTSDSVSKVNNTVRWAQTEPEVRVSWDELDADPMLLNVLNGTVDLRTAELRPHLREDYITRLAPVVYDSDATLPLLNSFLDQANGRRRGAEGVSPAHRGVLDHGEHRRRAALFYLFGPGRVGEVDTGGGDQGDARVGLCEDSRLLHLPEEEHGEQRTQPRDREAGSRAGDHLDRG